MPHQIFFIAFVCILGSSTAYLCLNDNNYMPGPHQNNYFPQSHDAKIHFYLLIHVLRIMIWQQNSVLALFMKSVTCINFPEDITTTSEVFCINAATSTTRGVSISLVIIYVVLLCLLFSIWTLKLLFCISGTHLRIIFRTFTALFFL